MLSKILKIIYNLTLLTLSSIDEGYGQLNQVAKNFGFLFNIDRLQTFTYTAIFEHCKKLEMLITYGGLTDIDAADLFNEVQAIAGKIAYNSMPL